MATKTELEFNYEPADFFEAPLSLSGDHGALTLENGKATYALASPIDPVPDNVRAGIWKEVTAALKLRQVSTSRTFNLLAPVVTQYGADGSIKRVGQLEGIAAFAFAGTADVVAGDASGNVVQDSRAERLKDHVHFISSLLPKMGNDTLRAMVDSYCRAIDDRPNELVHLYEVRDAVCKYFGNEAAARSALRISRDDWSDLRRLSNAEPLNQGRHRGIHTTNLRDATPEELELARDITRRIIEAFATVI